jgi:hypothetical protein
LPTYATAPGEFDFLIASVSAVLNSLCISRFVAYGPFIVYGQDVPVF